MKVLFLGSEQTHVYHWLKKSVCTLFFESAPLSYKDLLELNIDFIVSHGYRHVITPDIIELFNGKIINLHISYLPWNKGADPNFWSVYDGTPKGVTIHLVDCKLDTGAILVQRKILFKLEEETLATSYNKLQQAIFDLFKQSWPGIALGSITAKHQIGAGSFHNSNDKRAIFKQHNITWDTRLCDITILKKQLRKEVRTN